MKTTSLLILGAASVGALASCTIEPTVVTPATTSEVTTERTTRTTDPWNGSTTTRQESTTTVPGY
jgi:hypothetical protein